MQSTAARSQGLWKAEDFTIGSLGTQVRLDDTPTVTTPQAKIIFDLQGTTSRYVIIVAGTPGKIILGQKGVIGGVIGGTLKSVTVSSIPKRKWLEVRIELTPAGISVFIPTIKSKALLVKSGLKGRGGSAGFTAVSGRCRIDNFWFRNLPDLEISGYVTDMAENPKEGVLLTFSDAAYNTTTDAQGFYSSMVRYGWTGTVTPSSGTDTFVPPSRSYTLLQTDQTGQDFKVESLDKCETCHGGQVALAPNVMTYWDGTWWDGNGGPGMAGDASFQQGGHGDPDRRGAVPCAGAGGCHDTSLPQPSTHGNGILEGKGNPGANTYHLKSGFIVPGADPWDIQMTFDDYCTNECHMNNSVQEHRHYGLDDLTPPIVIPHPQPLLSPTFGTHLTKTDGESIKYPIDSDLTTEVSTAEPDYAPCISCHDPHGTGTYEDSINPNVGSNRMLREPKTKADYCRVCHQ